MSQKYLIRIAELERLLSEQAEALRQKDQQLSLVEETEAFLRSALTRAEEKIEEDEREIEHLRARMEKLRRMLFGTRSENCVVKLNLNRPGFPGECFICELRLPDHRFRWKHNKLFLLLPEEYGPAFLAIVDCYTSPPT